MIGNDLRRYEKVWDLSLEKDEQAILANALFNFLVDEELLEVADEETKELIDNLREKILELETEYEDNPSTKLETQISQLQEQLEEYNHYSDVYDLEPDIDRHYGHLQKFNIEKLGESYAIGDESQIEDATRESLEEYVEDTSLDSFPSWLIEQNINEDQIVSYIEEYYNESIYNDPENYLDDEDRELSNEQKEKYQGYKKRYDQLEERTFELSRAREVEKNEDRKDQIMEVIRKIEGVMDNLMQEIDEITENPEGDFSDEKIEEKIEMYTDYAKENPLSALDNLEIDYKDFVDVSGLIDDIIRHDGYVTVSAYDGNVEEVNFDGETYFIVRVE
jgi:hypothetical protein